MFSLDDYAYDLPKERIAQQPEKKRDLSKLLFLRRDDGSISHHKFHEIYHLLSPSDILVVNNTEVIPGRLIGNRDAGGKVELLILDYAEGSQPEQGEGELVYNCLIKSSKRQKPGARLVFQENLKAEVIQLKDGIHRVKFIFDGEFETLLYRIGMVPLPPYIKRDTDDAGCNDRLSYQTVYASQKGAVAAPTAGLHFTKELLARIHSKGVRIVFVTLHVGYGTFLPVRVNDIREHRMHSERYHIPEETAFVINQGKTEGRRIVAVGTTCVRTLEYASDERGNISSGPGACDLFIYPGYQFRVVDAMVTNFHLPQSTLLMLVSAFADREKVMNAYRSAIREGYRFYSYGDAMFIA